MSTTTDTTKITHEESRLEFLSSQKGLTDSVKSNIIGPSLAYALSRAHRLSGAVGHLLAYGRQYADVGEFKSYARSMSKDAKLDHLSQVWTYVQNAPLACQAFMDGALNEGALRYAGASKSTVRLGSGDDSRWVHLRDDKGEVISRAAYLERRIASIVEDIAKPRLAGGGAMLSATELKEVVHSAAEKLVSDDVIQASAQQRAEEVAVRTITSIATSGKNQVRPASDLAQEATYDLLLKLGQELGYTVLSDREHKTLEASATTNSDAAETLRTLEKIADNLTIPKKHNGNLDELAHTVTRANNVFFAWKSGDLVPGQALVTQ